MKKNSRRLMMVLAGVAVAASGCLPLDELGFDASRPEMVAFQTCGELESFLKAQALTKASWQQTAFSTGTLFNAQGFATSSPTSTSPEPGSPAVTASLSYSETNLQEQGVDEADFFKVDGTHAFAIHGTKMVIIEAFGERDPVSGGILQIDGGAVVSETLVPGMPFEMFLRDDHAVVLSRNVHRNVALQVEGAPERPSGTSLVSVLVYDVSNRKAPQLVREAAIEGEYLSSRRVGDNVFIVARSPFNGPQPTESLLGDVGFLFTQRNNIQRARLDAWMPYVYDISRTDATGSKVEQADCTKTYASRATNGDQAISILSVNLGDLAAPAKTTTILGDGAVLYGSKESLIVALTNYAELTYGGTSSSGSSSSGFFDWWDDGGEWVDDTPTSISGRELTYLHRFTFDNSGLVRYHATGKVKGWILNQFSISEHRGYVRVATMVGRDEWDSESMVHVLQPRDKTGLLQAPIGDATEFLDVIATVGGIGRDQDLYATRFQGDLGYLVTFREVDPLWIVDLTTPSAPRLRGMLEIPGYSTYLHPIANDKILAVGRGGTNSGIKISLFDVSNLDRPTAVRERTEGSGSAESEALTEHRAFRYLPESQLLFIPIDQLSGKRLHAYRINNGIEPAGTFEHRTMAGSGDERIRRTYRIGDYLYAYSRVGVSIIDLPALRTVAEIDLSDVP